MDGSIDSRSRLERYLDDGCQQVAGMSSRFSMRICSALAQMQKTIGVTGPVAEIGVYKGRFLISLALTLEGEDRAIGLDDFHHEGQMAEFQVNLAAHGVPADRVRSITCDTLKFDKVAWSEATGGAPVRFIHVDGRHTPRYLENDLKIAADNVADGGIICVDDMQHPSYPLLPQVVHMFLSQRPHFVVFCVLDRESIVGAGKYLICRRRWGRQYVQFLQKTFSQYEFVPAADFRLYRSLVLTPDPARISY